MKPKRYELEVESKVENLPVINDFVNDALTQFGADQATTFKVQLSIDEACTNVIKHAYSGGSGPLTLTMELVGNDLIITIGDRGKPFDPGIVPPPDFDSDVEKRRIGGLGIHFMRTLMDEISYSFNAVSGNRLTMRKSLSPKQERSN